MADIKKIKIGNTSYDLVDAVSGYTTNIGTVTSVNGQLPSVTGNVTISVPSTLSDLSNVTISSPTQGQNLTYDATNNVWKNTSTTTTVAWGGITGTLADQNDLKSVLDDKLENSSTGTSSIQIKKNSDSAFSYKYATSVNGTITADYGTSYGYSSSAGSYGVSIGENSSTSGNGNSSSHSVSIGCNSNANSYYSTALGGNASVNQANSAIQLGYGENINPSTFKVGFYNGGSPNSTNYQLLDGTTGLIPDARLSSNIARTSAIPTVNDSTITIQKNSTTVDSFTTNASSGKTINISVPTDTGDLTNNAGYIKGITSSDVTTALGYTPANVFIATYGTTTFADVNTALNAGKMLFCKVGACIYNYGGNYTNTSIWFLGVNQDFGYIEKAIIKNSTGWESEYFYCADYDLSNLSATGKATATSFLLPSTSSEDITKPASGGTVQATDYGWISLQHRITTAGSSIYLAYNSIISLATASSANQLLMVSIPVAKNDVVTVYYSSSNTNTTNNFFKFIKARGVA